MVTITEVPSTLPKQQIIANLSEHANAADINIYKVVADRRQPDSVRVLHEFVGNPSLTIGGAARKYPSFSPFYTTRIESSSSITTEDMRGAYAIYGTADQANTLVDNLAMAGITAEADPARAGDVWTRTLFGQAPLAGVVTIGGIALLLGSATFATGRRKVSVTRALLGGGSAKSLAKDYVAVVGAYLVHTIIISVVATFTVGGATGFNQFWPFVRSAALLWAAGILIVLAGTTLVFASFRRIGMSQVIKGEKPWTSLRFLSATTTALSFGLVFAILGSLTATALSTTEKSRFDESWRDVGAGVTLRFAGTTSSADFDSLTERFGDIYREHESRNQVVLAKPPTVPEFRPGNYGPVEGNSIVVNPEYLHRNVILNANAERVPVPDLASGELMLLIPSSVWDLRDQIVAEYEEWAVFQRSLTRFDSPLEVQAIQVQPNQEPFNYGANNFRFGSGQKDAVIAVISTRSEIVPAEFYVSAASNGAVIFDSAEHLQSTLTKSGVSDFVSSIDSANGLALNNQADRQGLMIALAFCLAVLLLIIFVSTAIAIWSYLERQRAIIMARAIHGFSFYARHSGLLLMSTSIVTATVLVNVAVGTLSSGIAFAGALAVLFLNGATVVALLRFGEGSLAARYQIDA